MTLYDPLTGLPNQALFEDRLRQSMARADRRRGAVAVLLVRLARGHSERELRGIADRLAHSVRRTDTVARLDSGAFAVIQTDLDHFDAAAFLAEKLIEALGHAGEQASVGVAIYPDDDRDAAALVAKAKAAMADTGGGFAFHAREVTAEAADHVRLARDLRGARERGELRLLYQPKMDLKSGRIVGAEALMRWAHPSRGLLAPEAFISIAEESELIVSLGQWALTQACHDAARWPKGGGKGAAPGVAVNVAPVQFEEPEFAAAVERALAAADLAPHRLELEITERSLMRDPPEVAGVLVRLGQLGVHITVDDFGTGYSALAYLRRYPVDALKIDRAFVADLPRNPNDAAIVRAIIGLAHSLNLGVVAEGVDNAGQLDFLKAEGCDQVQGFHIGAPMAAGEFGELVRA
jgi:diguanylate cyclase (GGDEF)-like protein